MKVLVDRLDDESVLIRIDRSCMGLAFDELEDETKDRGLTVGACGTVELTLEIGLALELSAVLKRELPT